MPLLHGSPWFPAGQGAGHLVECPPMDAFMSLLKKYALPDLTPGYLREFHAEVRAAIADGKLTEEEIAHLEQKKQELGLADEALAAIRLHVYAEAYKSVKEDARVTDDEWEELEQIQDYLNLTDREIAGTKRELYRMRILTELREGNMPVMQTPDIIPAQDESVHWVEKVSILESVPGSRYLQWKKEGNGKLIITSKRVVITGPSETRSHAYGSIVSLDCDAKGIEIHVNRRRPLRLDYADPDNRDVTASIVLSAIDVARKG